MACWWLGLKGIWQIGFSVEQMGLIGGVRELGGLGAGISVDLGRSSIYFSIKTSIAFKKAGMQILIYSIYYETFQFINRKTRGV